MDYLFLVDDWSILLWALSLSSCIPLFLFFFSFTFFVLFSSKCAFLFSSFLFCFARFGKLPILLSIKPQTGTLPLSLSASCVPRATVPQDLENNLTPTLGSCTSSARGIFTQKGWCLCNLFSLVLSIEEVHWSLMSQAHSPLAMFMRTISELMFLLGAGRSHTHILIQGDFQGSEPLPKECYDKL